MITRSNSHFDSPSRAQARHQAQVQGTYHYLGTKHQRNRNRVDWDEEIRKTDRIGRRSLVISGLCFALTLAVMIGINRTGINLDIPRRVISVACIVLACFVIRATLRHRAKVLRDREDRQLEAMLESLRATSSEPDATTIATATTVNATAVSGGQDHEPVNNPVSNNNINNGGAV